jgi:hypothetical protein
MDNRYRLVIEEIWEIPRKQRNLSRPKLNALFDGKLTKSKRDGGIVQAVHRYGYSQREVADFLDSKLQSVGWQTGFDTRNDSAEKPSVHPSRASGRTEEPLKSLAIFPFMLSLSKHS